jgi:hypothetical protein
VIASTDTVALSAWSLGEQADSATPPRPDSRPVNKQASGVVNSLRQHGSGLSCASPTPAHSSPAPVTIALMVGGSMALSAMSNRDGGLEPGPQPPTNTSNNRPMPEDMKGRLIASGRVDKVDWWLAAYGQRAQAIEARRRLSVSTFAILTSRLSVGAAAGRFLRLPSFFPGTR